MFFVNLVVKTNEMEFDKLSNKIIGCALEVHKQLGPGLLESTYEQCLAYELKLADIFHSNCNILCQWNIKESSLTVDIGWTSL